MIQTRPVTIGIPLQRTEWMDDSPDQVSMRQLRHLTKNALQRLVCQVSACTGLQHDAAGRALAADLERRIRLSASVSDALFGLTHAPQSLDVRLMELSRAVIGLLSDGDQFIETAVVVDGPCPRAFEDVLVRIAHELVGNAVKHGMVLRIVGRIDIAVQVERTRLVMTVSDDGWGFCAGRGDDGTIRGDGLRIARLLAEPYRGTLDLVRERGATVSRLTLPTPREHS